MLAGILEETDNTKHIKLQYNKKNKKFMAQLQNALDRPNKEKITNHTGKTISFELSDI